jgi:hypothetical protein
MEKKSIWSEIRNSFSDGDFVYIDSYLTSDDDEEGRVIAIVNTINGKIEYFDERAKTDSYAIEMINEVLKDNNLPIL